MDSVAAFRDEIMRNTSLNVFKQESKDIPSVLSDGKRGKGSEAFPQRFKRVTLKERRSSSRYKTTPVTLQELQNIPESAPIDPQTPKIAIKFPSFGSNKRKKPPLTKKGSLSEDVLHEHEDESDLELDDLVESNINILETPNVDDVPTPSTPNMNNEPPNFPKQDRVKLFPHQRVDMDENEIAGPSISERASVFQSNEFQRAKQKPVGKDRFAEKRKMKERSLTQPITEEEARQAGVLAREDISNEKGADDELSKY